MSPACSPESNMAPAPDFAGSATCEAPLPWPAALVPALCSRAENLAGCQTADPFPRPLAAVPDEWNLDSLLSSYSVEDMSVEPAGGFWFDGLGESPSFGTAL
jgi:hypothetical protein